ncbi:alpha/beta fold hydrolase [Olleya aquimaris]|uniref:Pimeloyl-ACP methyl ester carboxylesterase n=1 Tax=Olleya aquimaris TaxID=639310 RepID=A0A327RPT8_9FLAO|nr:alpha/beta hydrolase [Olleya aquimaris]RAJ18058.1 pimeloyl-ACP methyl ester carboxylesterase [Olleya aquimaris]
MTITHKNASVWYSVSGKGPAVVLLHGFLEDSTMWQDLVPLLSSKNKVICIDLLGHGKSESIGYVHTMEDMADAVHTVLKHLKLRKYTFIGHSMGGYVALAFAKQNTHNIKGLCLLNSTYSADDDEKKQLRTRANQMIQTNFNNMVRMSFANLFSAESKVKHQEAFDAALQIALKTSLQGYMAAQEGMKLREDNSKFFANATFKKLIIIGKKDTVIDVESTIEFSKKHVIDYQVFSEGHMSHIENKEEFLQAIGYFIE